MKRFQGEPCPRHPEAQGWRITRGKTCLECHRLMTREHKRAHDAAAALRRQAAEELVVLRGQPGFRRHRLAVLVEQELAVRLAARARIEAQLPDLGNPGWSDAARVKALAVRAQRRAEREAAREAAKATAGDRVTAAPAFSELV